MALNVQINFDKPLTSTVSQAGAIDEARVFSEPIPMMAPGRTISIFFDSYMYRPNRADMPMTYSVQLSYQDVRGRPYSDPEYPLDLGMYNETALPPKGLSDLVAEIEKLRKEAAKWTDGSRGLLVAAFDRERSERRQFRQSLRRQARGIRQSDGWRATARWQLQSSRQRLRK